MPTQSPSPSPLPALLLLLSAITGLVDAASILGLGKVFTANMTGNVVFLGFAAAGTPGFKWSAYVVAILAFMAGALVAGRLARGHIGRPMSAWLMRASLLETALLWIAAAIAIGLEISELGDARTFAIIALTGVAMGFRNATIRQLKVPDLTTTVLTLTITGLAADSSAAGGSNPNWPRRVAAVVSIFVGAAIGAWLVHFYGLASALAAAGLVGLAGTIAWGRHPTAATPVVG
ncbi:YoaK family protein [Sphingomonas abietis]|uniref:YoaK family protein n=1 Tax=Sphingomonas abietis TaxID=3012344 RepID=A0ABY7NPG8_9SPHN|nr:YoaK family protein [Sphingomonas abietis]WBO21824.1 YoaK family protein [Sphingomonas abietis]